MFEGDALMHTSVSTALLIPITTKARICPIQPCIPCYLYTTNTLITNYFKHVHVSGIDCVWYLDAAALVHA